MRIRIVHRACAESGAVVRRLEPDARADNDRAIAPSRSFGFEVDGTRRDFVRTRAGTFVDDLVVGRLL